MMKEKLELEQKNEAAEVDKKELESDFDELVLENLGQELKIKAVVEDNGNLEEENEDKSVRVDICNKKLKIIDLESLYYVSAHQGYSDFERLGGNIKYVFWFPSTMNMRQAVRRDFEKEEIAPVFEKKELKNLLRYLLGKNPKNVEKW
jgi:hypothetical protein